MSVDEPAAGFLSSDQLLAPLCALLRVTYPYATFDDIVPRVLAVAASDASFADAPTTRAFLLRLIRSAVEVNGDDTIQWRHRNDSASAILLRDQVTNLDASPRIELERTIDALASLDSLDQEIIRLTVLAGATVDELAWVLQVDMSEAHRLLSQAHNALRHADRALEQSTGGTVPDD